MEEVPEIYIDLQLGHASHRGKEILRAFWSLTGAEHYTDHDLLTGNAGQVPDAIRKKLDQAEAELAALQPDMTVFRVADYRGSVSQKLAHSRKASS